MQVVTQLLPVVNGNGDADPASERHEALVIGDDETHREHLGTVGVRTHVVNKVTQLEDRLHLAEGHVLTHLELDEVLLAV